MFIFQVVRAVGTAVDAIIWTDKAGEHYDSVSVEIFFDLFRKLVDLLIVFFVGTGEEN